MMFEVNDLAVASPATVSRCGMVYMEPVHIPQQMEVLPGMPFVLFKNNLKSKLVLSSINKELKDNIIVLICK